MFYDAFDGTRFSFGKESEGPVSAYETGPQYLL